MVDVFSYKLVGRSGVYITLKQGKGVLKPVEKLDLSPMYDKSVYGYFAPKHFFEDMDSLQGRTFHR